MKDGIRFAIYPMNLIAILCLGSPAWHLEEGENIILAVFCFIWIQAVMKSLIRSKKNL